MKEPNPVVIARKDYQAPGWTIEKTELLFELSPSETRVHSTLHLNRQSAGPLRLDGSDLELKSIHVDGEQLDASHYSLGDEHLLIESLPDTCKLSVVVKINPLENTALEGLYCTSGNFCTQCEAEGFRKITYYLDRPDVLSVFSVSIIADANDYPVMLSNGNLVSSEKLEDGRHRINWHDPFPKPCYLFALVAGNLARVEDTYTTRSNRQVDLHIYVEEHNLQQCQFAMDALKLSMKWDEEVYGLEYDLDLFMIVAVDDFNAGAMENKGLNVFNSKYVLADQALATDQDFLAVEAVIAHEYFHNWTGNRVTCRDWFQLSLKEGLTVFRDQEFSSDVRSREVKRIEDVRLLRAQQFAEDAGPMSHPIRPDQYIEINNFYTLTVYEKGAEVIRMIHTLLGSKNYYKGIALYFERHDGSAVTCDDFVIAMEDASGISLATFRQWYSQSGTPRVRVTDRYDAAKQRYTLTVSQQNPDSSGVPREPLHIPLRMGLLDNNGKALAIDIGRKDDDGGSVLDLVQAEQSFIFENIQTKPVPSLLRGFSAPVILDYDYDNDALAFLLTHDSDSFNRWEAGQRLAMRLVDQQLSSHDASVPPEFVDAFNGLLNDKAVDAGFKALVLQMPSIKTVSNSRDLIDVQAIDKSLRSIRLAIAQYYQPLLTQWVTENIQSRQSVSIGERSLANTALSLLGELPSEQWQPLALEQYQLANNMTDRVAALQVLCNQKDDVRTECVQDFYQRYSAHKLVVDKWFALQASAQHSHVVNDVMALSQHEAFDQRNPNRLRSLIGVFASGNTVYFHATDGAGYTLVSKYIVSLDRTNPQVAATLVAPFLQWRRYCEPQQSLMQSALAAIASQKPLSADVFEIVSKALDSA